MAVSTDTDMANGHYVPFRTERRGGDRGDRPVGTLFADGNAIGAAGGGTVEVGLTMGRQPFGFRIMFVPTIIAVRDNLASLENVNFIYALTNNSRLPAGTNVDENIVPITSGGIQVGRVIGVAFLIEPEEDAPGLVMRATWATNTDGKAYHLHTYGVVYDAEIMTGYGQVPDLVGGLR